jgi:hypothetical protein
VKPNAVIHQGRDKHQQSETTITLTRKIFSVPFHLSLQAGTPCPFTSFSFSSSTITMDFRETVQKHHNVITAFLLVLLAAMVLDHHFRRRRAEQQHAAAANRRRFEPEGIPQ